MILKQSDPASGAPSACSNGCRRRGNPRSTAVVHRRRSSEFAQQGPPGLALPARTHQGVQPCDPLLEVSIKPVVRFRAQQLLPKCRAVAEGKISRIVRPQDTRRAWYERRNDWYGYSDCFADDVGSTFEVRREYKHVRASQQVDGTLVCERSQPSVARIRALLRFHLPGKIMVYHGASVFQADPGRRWQLTYGISRPQRVLYRSQVRQHANLETALLARRG